MNMVAKVFVGVDISKKHLDICLYPIDKMLHVENSTTGINHLLLELSAHKENIQVVVCEATGGYEALMLETLKEAGYKTWLVEPKRIKSFIASEGIRSKTDKGDAKMIALFASQKERPYERVEPSAAAIYLSELCKRRMDLKKIIVTEKLRLEHRIASFCKKQIERHIDYIEKQVAAIEEEIDEIIKQDSELTQKIMIVTSVPGVGKTTAATMIAELPELGKVERREIAALVGVAPYTRESGTYKGQARTTGGRQGVRQILFMAAMSAIQHNEMLKTFYNKLIERGKRRMVALVAVIRKLVVMINAMVRHNHVWRID